MSNQSSTPSTAESSGDAHPPTDDHTLAEAAEAIIFAADEPVTAERIAEIVSEVTGQPEVSDEEVQTAIETINEEYEASGRALEIHEWGEGYRMATRSTLSPFVKTLFVGEQEKSLSRSLMETLAVIAYRQPVTRPEVDFIRGVNSDYAIGKLLEMELVDVEGRADSLGRPLLYGTTSQFLEQFGLKSLDDLPTLREVEELLDDPAFDEERAKLLRLDKEEEVSVDDILEEVEEEEKKEEAESSSPEEE
ncbi:SMC-Scp complex subunit ScpB [Salinibacter sp. 10B]|uniref:SMC-Scp complex subunit ScpB n=1 Tax=Salinibacter sp. 10B TaxID=1923971 RepID=UPI000CF51756|nr:SMC-Scp complex subunit ScpB [Salinibacter sp. 10B]PQJ33467.1 SMC-Scp complex subunit ScpB [Salinibacter sp. 10B]